VHLLTQTCLDQLPALEDWLAKRGLQAIFDVLPIVACRPVVLELIARGYRLVAWQPSLYRLLSVPIEAASETVEVEEVSARDSEFRDTFLGGYETPAHELEHAAIVNEARWRAENARCFLARSDGKPIAAATLVLRDRSARLANCATLPHARDRGAQSALIRARLRCAVALGLELAVSDARQGGGSLRNLARTGFAVSAHITQWHRA
jgi:hypothetical protein